MLEIVALSLEMLADVSDVDTRLVTLAKGADNVSDAVTVALFNVLVVIFVVDMLPDVNAPEADNDVVVIAVQTAR